MYQTKEMEECDGGEASSSAIVYGSGDLKKLMKNKKLGGKRSSPQENPEVKKVSENPRILKKCPQSDFISQNDVFFNEHMTKVHAGQPNCHFCFMGFRDYFTLKKDCENAHKENKSGNQPKKLPEGRKRPCRFFKNGKG